MDLIERRDDVSTETPVQIIYCYGAWQKPFENVRGVESVSGLIDVTKDIPKDNAHRWLIIDDLMSEAMEKGRSDSLFTKHSHHLNLTVFFVTQNLFLKSLRNVSVNTHYFFLGKNPRESSYITNLAKQMSPGNTRFFTDA